MENNCISTKNVEDTCSIYSASKPVETFIGRDTNETIDKLFNTLLQRFQKAIVTSQINGSKLTHESVALLYHYVQKMNIRRVES